MMNPADARNEQIRELLKQRSNVHGQDAVESQFYKPMAQRNSSVKEKLYFQGVQGKAPSRIYAGKNNSSIERVFGLDPVNSQDHHDNSTQPSPAYSNGRGKRIIPNTVKSTNNLISGNYGVDPTGNMDVQIKPYSKQKMADIGRPPRNP